MAIIKLCSYCDNPVNGSICYNCNDHTGIVEGEFKNGEFIEYERNVCSRCKEFNLCKEIKGEYVCFECLQDEDDMIREMKERELNENFEER